MERLIIKAFAKINLALDVLGKRKDGYHGVEMVMQGIDLYDLVELEKAKDGISLTCSIQDLETDSRNLAYRAAELLINNYKQVSAVKIHLNKRIPLAAGLAGGSSDAAAVLLGMNELFGIGLTLNKMEELAAELGSDVPFCLKPLTAIAQGRGELVKEITACPRLWLALLKPNFGVSTREVYEHLHNITIKKRPDIKEVLRAIENQHAQDLISAAENVLEYATFDLYPQLNEYKQELISAGAQRVMMSGSGPTLIAFSQNELSARRIMDMLNKTNRKIFICRTLEQKDFDTRVIQFS